MKIFDKPGIGEPERLQGASGTEGDAVTTLKAAFLVNMDSVLIFLNGPVSAGVKTALTPLVKPADVLTYGIVTDNGLINAAVVDGTKEPGNFFFPENFITGTDGLGVHIGKQEKGRGADCSFFHAVKINGLLRADARTLFAKAATAKIEKEMFINALFRTDRAATGAIGATGKINRHPGQKIDT